MHGALWPCCGLSICAWLQVSIASVPPVWWQKGWPRKRVGSVAEAELLSQLAVLLMPNEPIEECFRRFPSPEGWGGHYLEPDLSAYGLLRDEDAALFLEYDGHWRHGQKDGVERDALKNAALLSYAPPGSYVIRISHTTCTGLKDNVLCINVGQWRAGDVQALSRLFMDVVRQAQVALEDVLRPEVIGLLVVEAAAMPLSERAVCFTQEAVAAMGCNTSEEVSKYLISEGFSTTDSDKVLVAISQLGINIEQRLQPHLRFLSSLGLSTSQAARVLAGHPPILGYSIEQNLKPKVQWLLDLGLGKAQVAKAVARHPQILGYSLKQNLKPTVEWLSNLGLGKNQVARVVAVSPRVLGYSIEQNLKPTVEWLSNLGLGKSRVAKVIAVFPQIHGYSIEQNLKPTVEWLSNLGLGKSQVGKVVAGHPQILSYSIEENLKPTVRWLSDMGLGQCQVARVVAGFPSLMGCSISKNLQAKVRVLDAVYGRVGTAALVARWPQLVTYSMHRLTERLKVLGCQNRTDELLSAMRLTNERFLLRFPNAVDSG